MFSPPQLGAMTTGMTDQWHIETWTRTADRDRLVPAIDSIFFEASLTRSFADEAQRESFRDRWLGRFMRHYPEYFYVATRSDSESVGGYLAGCLDDPAHVPLFNDVGYFPLLSDLTAEYPAHLHINMAADVRGQGLGSRILQRFAEDARAAGAQGLHIVTGDTSRSIRFYESCGLTPLRQLEWGGVGIVMMGLRLSP